MRILQYEYLDVFVSFGYSAFQSLLFLNYNLWLLSSDLRGSSAVTAVCRLRGRRFTDLFRRRSLSASWFHLYLWPRGSRTWRLLWHLLIVSLLNAWRFSVIRLFRELLTFFLISFRLLLEGDHLVCPLLCLWDDDWGSRNRVNALFDEGLAKYSWGGLTWNY